MRTRLPSATCRVCEVLSMRPREQNERTPNDFPRKPEPNAIVGFGGKVLAALIAHLRIGNDAVAKTSGQCVRLWFVLGMTEKDVEVLAAARPQTPTPPAVLELQSRA